MRFLAMKSVQLVQGLGMFVAIGSIAAAQVVIDMPAPKKAKVRAEAAVTPATPSVSMAANVTAPPAPVMVADVGDIALSRYAGARTYPRDTYHYADHYAGIRQYGYPYSIWWGAWGFPGFGCGNKFVGFVGSPHCH